MFISKYYETCLLHLWHKSILESGLKLIGSFAFMQTLGGGFELLVIPFDEVEVIDFDELGMLKAFLRTNWGSERFGLSISFFCFIFLLEFQLLLLKGVNVGAEVDFKFD